MSNEWNTYICSVNNALASIRLDMGIRADVPDSRRPWLLWVWVYFKEPRPDGLSSENESKTLWALEDALRPVVEKHCQGVLSGCITTAGRREFYFYAPSADDFAEAVCKTVGDDYGYRFAFDSQQDSEWSQYLNVLYPSGEQLELMGNRDLLESMKAKGDTLEEARTVSHWAGFGSAAGRSTFIEAVRRRGYDVVSERQAEGTGFPFQAAVSRFQSMDQQTVDELVLELYRDAQAAGGKYDGWECELKVSGDTKTK